VAHTALLLASTRPTWPDILVFAAAAAVILVGSLGVVTSRNPVHAALSLVMTLFGVAVLFIEQEADFLAAVQIIVYAGAVMVLFVFVIMLLNAGEEERLPHGSRVATMLGVPALIIGLGIAAAFVTHIASLDRVAIGGPEIMNGSDVFGNPQAIGNLLFSKYLLPFEVTSILILVAIMGAVVLARREED
jgi:NADH-quinone oxidoreductase subunit J